MSAALVIVYACLVAVEVAVVFAWVVATRRHRWPVRPSRGDVVIGGVTSFLDTLGIGNYAQITALFKLRGHPPDELIPGTLNVGNAVGILFSATLFISTVRVEPTLLMAMVISAGAGAWIGAGIVSRMRRRLIQVFMGMALLLAALFFTMTNLGIIPPTGSAWGSRAGGSPWRSRQISSSAHSCASASATMRPRWRCSHSSECIPSPPTRS